MSARSQRGTHDTPTTKRFRSPRITVRNRTAKPHITYDYDAAISQPDVPNLLDYKNIGRGVMVSGVPLRKKALKTRLKGRIISRKNFQKRSQEYKTKSLIQKNASPIKTHTRPSRINQKTMASSSIFEKENYIGEKENITYNDTNNVEHLSNSLRRNLVVDAKNISYKDTKEAIENDNNNQMTQQIKNETSENYEIAKKKSPIQVKGSKIPRAKIAVFPVHTFYELHSTKKVKTKESPHLKYSTTNSPTDNIDISEKSMKKRSSSKEEQSTHKQDVVRFNELQKDTNWNKEETSTLEADEEAEDRGLTSADESPAIISSIDDPRVLTILRSLKLNCPCKSCSEHNPVSTNQQEDNSDLKSSSPEEIRKKKWSLKYRKYIETTSDDVDISSDCNSEYSKKEKRGQHKAKYILTHRIKTSSIVHAPPKITNRRRTSFSFFNTLFDIVFWPYLFLKTNR